MKSTQVLVGMVLCAALLASSPRQRSATAGTGEERPNIVMIVVDDMRFDEYGGGGHSYLETPNIDSLARNGVTFTRAYHVTPLCSPNRASLLTGQYVSRHGIFDNTARSQASHRLDLFAVDLQHAGYRTAHVGKWHMGNDPTPRPGYDYWVSFAGQGLTYDPDLFENGSTHRVEGYITDIFSERGATFIRESDRLDDSRPFFLYIGHKAVHPEAQQLDDGSVDLSVPKEFIPADRHRGTYDGQVVDRRVSVRSPNPGLPGKPMLSEALGIRQELIDHDPVWATWIDPGVSEETVQRRAEMMLAVDEGLGTLLAALRETDELGNTIVIFTSDNGYFYGEHGLTIERRLPYEESVRSPLLIQYPDEVAGGRIVDAFVQSIDYAATALDAAGVPVPSRVQGRSLLPVLTGEAASVREVAYMEYYSHENPFAWTAKLDYRIVRKGPHKYIRWIRFEEGAELYDLEADPYEERNLVDDPEYGDVLEDMQAELRRMVVESLGLSDE